MTYIRYWWYVVAHRWRVMLASRKVGLPLWRALLHDASKFMPDEFFPYARFFYGSGGKPAFKKAALRHCLRNKHHWQYWISERQLPLAMPSVYVREMVADWIAMGNIHEWYELSKDAMVIHTTCRALAESLMREL